MTEDHKFNPHDKRSIAYACLIPVTVLLSGLFAGLTLGYMSLDVTQLNVLSISGTPKQREYANKIKPVRKNGHLLLVTLLLANMIVNESLPLIADQVLGSGVQSLVVSTVLIVIFAEVIPQSLFTRYGLFLGAKMAVPTTILIYMLGIVSWPIAKILEFILGPHHGIIYRRAELKELIALHSHGALHGGDLKNDTVTIIGATLDLQEKVVMQAMTPIADVFMLSIDAKLDYEMLKKICLTGHSRVPVYEEVDLPSGTSPEETPSPKGLHKSTKGQQRVIKAKRIVGVLLVKNCVLLDPKDAVPLRKIPLNKVLFVPNNEPLLGILDKFQEGRSHMAIVSRFSVEKAASVKQAVKRGLTQRLMQRVGMGDSSDSESDDNSQDEKSEKHNKKQHAAKSTLEDVEKGTDGNMNSYSGEADPVMVEVHRTDSNPLGRVTFHDRGRSKRRVQRRRDLEAGTDVDANGKEARSRRPSFQLTALEQSMPADAVLAKQNANEFLLGFDPAVNPLGIITLEDVLEELIGEEIYDEFDPQGAHADLSSYVPSTVPGTNQETPPAISLSSPAPTSHHHGISHHVSSMLHLAPKTRDHHQEVHVTQNHLGHSRNENHIQGASAGNSGLDMIGAVPAATPDTTAVGGGADAVGHRPGQSRTASMTNATPALMPIALKGLTFLRSRSAPPTRREEIEASRTPDAATAGGAGEHSIDDNKPADGNRDDTDGSRIADSLESSNVTAPPDTGIEGKAADVLTPLPTSAPVTILAPVPAAALSATPTLEAILLDRKRRLGGIGAGSGTASKADSVSSLAAVGGESRPRTFPSASGKGARFKSSPLGGTAGVGVVVAEKVREGMLTGNDGGNQRNTNEEGERISGGKDKKGPDKE